MNYKLKWELDSKRGKLALNPKFRDFVNIAMSEKALKTIFQNQIVELLQSARKQVVRAVNQTMVFVYFEVGRLVVEEEQEGEDRAKYGKKLLKELSEVLSKEFGKGFSITNL